VKSEVFNIICGFLLPTAYQWDEYEELYVKQHEETPQSDLPICAWPDNHVRDGWIGRRGPTDSPPFDFVCTVVRGRRNK
jgi:hypothetical protein